MNSTNLVYGVAGDNLVFIDAQLAQDLAALRHDFGTWGQARAGLSASQWGRIAESLEDGELSIPGDDEPFDLDYMPGFADGDWPEWPEQMMLDWMPREVLDTYGRREDSVLNGEFAFIDPAREADVVAALQQLGWSATKDESLVSKACGY